MKKLFIVLMVLTLAFTVVACGNNADNTSNVLESQNTNNDLENQNTGANNTPSNQEEGNDSETPETPSYYPITFVDGMDRPVTIESEPMTIVSLAPSMTEMIFLNLL